MRIISRVNKMISMRLILNLLIICAFIPYGLSQEGGIELTEDYVDEEGLPESNLEDGLSSTSKPNNTNEVKDPKKTQFSEDRFTKLFQSRRQRPRPSPLSPRFASKPKPTLPSFIKNTPPIIKAQPTPVPNQRSITQKTTATPKTPSTRTPPRGSANTNRRNQSNSNRSNNQSTASPVSTTDSSSRRRFGSNSNPKRNNSTIPATKPKRI